MQLKAGVKLAGVRPEIVLAILAIDPIARKFNAELVITSLTDSTHSPKSLHYQGLAADIRTHDIPETRRKLFADAVHNALGDEFDVVLEGDHLHIEFDPK